MMCGGGFQEQSHLLTARSIENLHNFGLISLSSSLISLNKSGSLDCGSKFVVRDSDGVIELKDLVGNNDIYENNGVTFLGNHS